MSEWVRNTDFLRQIEMYTAKHSFVGPLEPGLSLGAALYHFVAKYCGTISVGPFGCMNSIMTEAVATVEMTTAGREKAARNAGTRIDLGDIRTIVDSLPFLSVELDGNVFSRIEEASFETFLLQAHRLADGMEKRRNGRNGSAAANCPPGESFLDGVRNSWYPDDIKPRRREI